MLINSGLNHQNTMGARHGGQSSLSSPGLQISATACHSLGVGTRMTIIETNSATITCGSMLVQPNSVMTVRTSCMCGICVAGALNVNWQLTIEFG